MTQRASNVNYTGGTNAAGSSQQNCAKSGDRPVTIRAAVFFDGTLNNRTNVALGRQGVNKGDSYSNGLSNIAILERNWEKSEGADYCFSAYVEGIGTTDGEADCTIAAATGQGGTGIIDKVDAGIGKIIRGIEEFVSPGEVIECIILDCFGFSRGAAAARHFVYAALFKKGDTLKEQLESKNYTVSEVRVEFVGLFDCVVSYGLHHTDTPKSLHLDAIRFAGNVVQLAASDEHRKHFPLTTITSASNGIQIFLPGAHSDIGGGYANDMDEIDLQLMDLDSPFGLTDADRAAIARERQWLLDFGWFHEDEIHDINFWNELRASRRGISNHYSRIPLKMMAGFAKKRGVIFLQQMEVQYRVPSELHPVEATIAETSASSPEHWLQLNTAMMRQLRHHYLHFSAFYGSTCGSNEPVFTNNDPVNGRRRRKILYG